VYPNLDQESIIYTYMQIKHNKIHHGLYL